MPNCDFYACGEDHRKILECLLADGPCRLLELSSKPGHETMQFESLADFEAHFQFQTWKAVPAILLQLYPHAAQGTIHQRRVHLKNVAAGAPDYRYSTEGWGMVQL